MQSAAERAEGARTVPVSIPLSAMSLLAPASRLLARFSVSRKLMLIYLLDLSAVIFVSAILVREQNLAIEFARKELAGSAYLQAIVTPLVGAARDPGRSPDTKPIEAAEAEHGPALESGEPARGLLAALRQLPAPGANGPAAPDALQAEVLASGHRLITRIGNQSNLILDPDLDSYYTMSLVVLRYPELLQLLHGLPRKAQQAAQPARGRAGSDARTAYLVAEGRLDGVLQAIRSDFEEAVAAGGAPLAARLQPPHDRLMLVAESVRTASRSLVDRGASPEGEQLLEDARATAMDALQVGWLQAAQALDGLLQARIDRLYGRLIEHLAIAAALLLLILGIVWFVARQIALPLTQLAGVADAVRLTGDTRRRAEWKSGDEIGRLVVGFNDMLEQMGRQREIQQELAASARAADAQRQLVEATPIALVVTSIPDHAVLHANHPAERWLAGQLVDPWRTALDPAVRARFFQQLADRGAVHEFEVRWWNGREASWAVLSAQRVRYQEQDAVLTAFSPINHLKLMERRLALWAKVFEASSEGIVIVDADHRVVTTNQAFSRQTGHELGEVIGEPCAELFRQVDGQPGLPAEVWPALARRGGHWQGELEMLRRDGSSYPAWLMANTVRQSEGEVSHHILTTIDISDRKRSEQRIRFLAEHDVLTELPNRALCVERLRLALQQARRQGHSVAVLFIDLDRFKNINDSLGHHIGDALLRSVAQRLCASVREGDTVSRQGGDEFVVVLSQVRDAEEVRQVVQERLIPAVRQPHAVEGAELHVSCSVGIAIGPQDSDDLDELMRHADVAMYEAKSAGRDLARFFAPSMTEQAQLRMALEADLRRAIEQQQFELHWQPRVAASDGRLVGAEGLIRWHHPSRGLVSPAEFIPIAEETGLIVAIGAWVIDEACRQAARWREEGRPAITLSINLSARQLRQSDLVERVTESLARHGVAPRHLELELTESLAMEDADAHLRQLQALRQLGVRLSIDDFGTGHSSLAYLTRLPLDKLKIDRAFVKHMLDDAPDRAVTMAVIALGRTLGLTVVAEGVETLAQLQMLRQAHCDELQGYHIARPMPAAAFADWADRRAVTPADVSAIG